jgi:hypothetical protein
MTVVVAAAVVAGACGVRAAGQAAERVRSAAWIAVLTGAAACAAGLSAGGGPGAAGAALVPAACALLAAGLRTAAGALGIRAGTASFAGAGLALAPAALLFVADPWIDWRGGTSESPVRAARVLAANPLAAMTAPSVGLGVDFQRMPLLYDGPSPGVPGLSLVGQYYPSVPPSPLAWAAVAGAVGAVLVAAARERR